MIWLSLVVVVFHLGHICHALDMWDSMKVAIQPEEVLEMEAIKRPLSVYITDSTGKLVTILGGGTWTCKVSIISDHDPSLLVGTSEVSFVNGTGTANFPTLRITEAGSGYILQFKVTYPTNANIAPVNTTMFDVGGRPLGIRLGEIPHMRGTNQTFEVTGTIWDEALDQAADATVLAGLSWECDITMASRKMSLLGNTVYNVSPGNGNLTFSDLTIPTVADSAALHVECYSPDYHARPTISLYSDYFIVTEYPETALLRKTAAEVYFEGPYQLVEPAILVYKQQGLHGVATCVGCPPGVLQKPKQLEMREMILQPPLSGWEPCTSPIYLNPDLSCQLDMQDMEEYL